MAKDQQLITPMEKLALLGDMEGAPVVAAGLTIPGAGGGLRDALTIDPIRKTFGERMFVLIECHVADLRFPEVGDSGARKRVHVMKEDAIVIVPADFAQKWIDEEALRIEEAKGIARLNFEEEEAAELKEEHDEGLHHSLVAGCAQCDEERLEAESEGLPDYGEDEPSPVGPEPL